MCRRRIADYYGFHDFYNNNPDIDIDIVGFRDR